MKKKLGVPLTGVSLSCPLIWDRLPPVTRLMTLAMPAVSVVKFADCPVRMLNDPKLWNRLLPESLPSVCGIR